MKYFANISGSLVLEQIAADIKPIQDGNWVEHVYPHINAGFTYDSETKKFYPPQLYPSFILDKATQMWNPPIEYPSDGNIYYWDESTQYWITGSL